LETLTNSSELDIKIKNGVAFGDLIYNEMDRNIYFLSIYDIYFNDDYDVNYSINNDSNMNDDVFINKLEVEFKENMKGAHQKKIISLVYIDHFNFKFTIIIDVYLFKNHIDTTHIDEVSLRFTIHYSKT
jgi:ABC-type antimicrobial peptide transport system permease subunit